MAEDKISIYSLSDLKSTLDDHLPIYLTSPNLPPTSTPLPKPLRFTQSHLRTTIRLALGYTAVLLALYIFYLDYYLKVPWREHKTITAWAVLGYGVLNVGMMGWSWFGGESGLVFEGSRRGKRKVGLRVYSHAPHRKYEPVYRVVVFWSVGEGKERKRELTVGFTRFFQGDGTFVSGEFERWLRGEFPELLAESGKVEVVKAVEDEVDEDDVLTLETPKKATGSQALDGTPAASAKKRAKKQAG